MRTVKSEATKDSFFVALGVALFFIMFGWTILGPPDPIFFLVGGAGVAASGVAMQRLSSGRRGRVLATRAVFVAALVQLGLALHYAPMP